MSLTLRFAQPADAAVLLKIYTPFVENEDSNLSDVSFEFVAPSVEEFAERIRTISADFPYLVLEENGQAIGYAYAHPYAQRAAYQWSVEVTVYLEPRGQGKGYGAILYRTLEKLLALQGVTNLYACITKSNEHSVKMHESLGYKLNGVFTQCAFKHGHWLDMVWLEKQLQEHVPKPELIKPIGKIDRGLLQSILENAVRE